MKVPLGLVAVVFTLPWMSSGQLPAQARPQGPCDIYGAAGTPCVAAHSTTRALYASYSGPLYQVKRQSDGRTLDIGVAPPAGGDAGGYANAAGQDAFCANTICVINLIYDQSGNGNHLYQAPPGPNFPGPAKRGFDTQPIADMATITIAGHKAYGVFIMPGMGFRNNNAGGIAINDEPEGIYYVIDGTHYDISLAGALTKAHANRVPITTSLPTPGAPSRYAAKTSTIPRLRRIRVGASQAD